MATNTNPQPVLPGELGDIPVNTPGNSVPLNDIKTAPAPVNAVTPGLQTFDDGSTLQTFDDGSTLATNANGVLSASNATDTSFGSPATSSIVSGVNNAQQQQTLATQQGQQANVTDWRFRVSLGPAAGYLYNAPNPGILQPLRSTNGVLFPYTPKVDLTYKAQYSTQDFTHSNMRSYFYQNSYVSEVSVSSMFTAQNTEQANYMLAVIHFFRSASKMFYGQDAQRGSPPPLLFLNGFGEYQFNKHPVVLSDFSYSLPDDVDYIRAGIKNNLGLNMTTVSNILNSGVASGAIGGPARLAAAFTTPGALPDIPFGSVATSLLAPGVPTMVPTKINISVKFLPINSRQQVSKQFSLQNFANGNGLRGGLW